MDACDLLDQAGLLRPVDLKNALKQNRCHK